MCMEALGSQVSSLHFKLESPSRPMNYISLPQAPASVWLPTTTANRQHTGAIASESFNIKGLYIAVQAVLVPNVPRSSNRVTNCRLSPGSGITQQTSSGLRLSIAVPVHTKSSPVLARLERLNTPVGRRFLGRSSWDREQTAEIFFEPFNFEVFSIAP
ncbi:hypothetical protein BD310DRAFT_982637 [Dichomitus squalens]|uniref:Uncharacterized protein n=1 Tax=Dichomitus squalens TaxID=114155 RepID=A0A4Q9PG76_9APHY|nr:hypothetical protein BD310DRAFT_982637 [Dichomitus squalens]